MKFILIALLIAGAAYYFYSSSNNRKLAEENVRKGAEFLASNQEKPLVTTTASGLQYEDTVVGTGAEAKPGRNVTVHYTGWLFDNGVQGAKFDSSKDRDEPFIFPLGGGMVIKGWDEGVQGMKEGGQRTLIIPAALGYGARGAGAPPSSPARLRRPGSGYPWRSAG